MHQFIFYLKQGLNHITDLNGIDHMVFVITLCAIYSLKQWKQLLILISAFTIGHSITLALSGLQIISVNQQLVETLIPITIFMTSIHNIIKKKASEKRIQVNYFLALCFGLIHGMGFSNFFRMMMMGISDSIVLPLFSFNVGIEIGQIIIVCLFLLAYFILKRFFSINHENWNLVISGAGGGISAVMIINAFIA